MPLQLKFIHSFIQHPSLSKFHLPIHPNVKNKRCLTDFRYAQAIEKFLLIFIFRKCRLKFMTCREVFNYYRDVVSRLFLKVEN